MSTKAASRIKQIAQLLGFVVVCQLAGAVGALTASTGGSAWYQALEKPFFQPPSWVFGPVWTLLYTLMGVAAFLVFRQGWHRRDVRAALGVFAGQLLVNAVWTPVFFGAHLIGPALVVIVVLGVLIALTMRLFFPISRTAGWLLVPYLAWVVFATVLNAALWAMNG